MTEYQAQAIEARSDILISLLMRYQRKPGLARQTAAEMVLQRASQILEGSSITTRSLAGFKRSSKIPRCSPAGS